MTHQPSPQEHTFGTGREAKPEPQAAVARPAAACGSGAADVIVKLGTSEIREGWANFLSRYDWDAFATLTYSGSVWSDEKVVKNFRAWLFEWQLRTAVERGLATIDHRTRWDAYGRAVGMYRKVRGLWFNGYRKQRGHPVYVLGIEPHKNGSLHAHAIIKWSDALPDLSRKLGHEIWFGSRADGNFNFGMARIEPPRGQDDVALYVSKYISKGGELFLSPNFDAGRMDAV